MPPARQAGAVEAARHSVVDRDTQSELLGLGGLALDHPQYATKRALALARSILGMDVGFVARITETELIFEAVDGDQGALAWDGSRPVPIEDSYCQRMVTGELENLVVDAQTHPVTREIKGTAESGIGTYIGVPIWLADGSLYGSFCCLNRDPDRSLGERDVRFLHLMARTVADSLDRHRILQTLARASIEESSTQALIAAVEAREPATAVHSLAVVDLAVAVAERLEVDDVTELEVRQSALLHDIGKIGIPDQILLKAGPLTPVEWDVMREHSKIGERIVRTIPGLSHLAPIIRAEHERWDGMGYPDGLAGEAIPLASRICLACDAFHAMTSDRPYRSAMPIANAIAELYRHRGTQFCPRTVDALIAVLDAA